VCDCEMALWVAIFEDEMARWVAMCDCVMALWVAIFEDEMAL